MTSLKNVGREIKKKKSFKTNFGSQHENEEKTAKKKMSRKSCGNLRNITRLK